jgi:pimeloyl-ACP methyl ester carboxylesterase
MAAQFHPTVLFNRKKLTGIIGGLIILLILIYGGLCFYVADTFTRPNNNPITKSPTLISKNYQDVSFITSDNVHLNGWIFPGTSSKAVIMVPGMWQNRQNDGYNGMAIGKELVDSGYTVLLYDPRGNGTSDKVRLGYGFVEDRDLMAAITFLKSKHFLEQRIGIIGDSTGAVVALHLAPHISGIGAIIADMKQLLEERMVSDKQLPRFLHPGIFFMAEHVFGIPITDSVPEKSMDLTPERTYLFLHGEKDNYITPDNSKILLSKANMYSTLVTFKNATHVKTYASDPQLYHQTVFSFLEQQLGK